MSPNKVTCSTHAKQTRKHARSSKWLAVNHLTSDLYTNESMEKPIWTLPSEIVSTHTYTAHICTKLNGEKQYFWNAHKTCSHHTTNKIKTRWQRTSINTPASTHRDESDGNFVRAYDFSWIASHIFLVIAYELLYSNSMPFFIGRIASFCCCLCVASASVCVCCICVLGFGYGRNRNHKSNRTELFAFSIFLNKWLSSNWFFLWFYNICRSITQCDVRANIEQRRERNFTAYGVATVHGKRDSTEHWGNKNMNGVREG